MSAIDDCLAEALTLPGVRLVTLLDYVGGLPIAARGEDPLSAEEDASGTADFVQRALATPALTASESGDSVEELIVVGAGGTHVILLGGEAMCLHTVLEPGTDLTTARARLRDVLHRLVAPV
ncbi:hypothetical protein [Actinocorallia longicatena]|uniref:Roadblock/LAMTOR2 domain-containing protein n=1 Tax=Actinocorallia longicatena TaxID=111803 RepID=A0ABP6Q655_9ACTN